MSEAERRILDAAKACSLRWGLAKVTVDDIAAEAGVSRATLYRLFPGGKDVLFDALRVRDIEEFFVELTASTNGAVTLDDLLVAIVQQATVSLRGDQHLAAMLASEPGETLSQLTVDGLPRIIRMATLFLAPRVEPYVGRDDAQRLVDLLARLVISYFLAPSDAVDLGDRASAARFIRANVLPILSATVTTTTTHHASPDASHGVLS
jgi:AcrR family transcriptional regulator